MVIFGDCFIVIFDVLVLIVVGEIYKILLVNEVGDFSEFVIVFV